MLKQSLSQKQKLKISQQNIQLFKLMELNTMQLDEKIKEELDTNPALLDLSEDKAGYTEPFQDKISVNPETIADYTPPHDSYDNLYEKEHRHQENYQSDDEFQSKDLYTSVEDNASILTRLLNQLKYFPLNQRQFAIGEYLIGNIDNDGYMRRPLANIVDDLAFRQNIDVDEKEVEDMLHLIQTFDPPGVGAQNLQESLVLQLKRLPKDLISKTAIRILEENFELFCKKQYERLIKKYKITEAQFEEVLQLILSLNPKPVVENTENELGKFIVPDFFVYDENGKLHFELQNYNMPNLTINKEYVELVKKINQLRKKSQSDKDALLFMRDRLMSAESFITNIRQRQETMVIIMQSIIDVQRDFFFTGDESMLKPMTLKYLSELTGFDISTISRITNSKFVQTVYGIFSLKFFFSEKLSTEDGEEVSTRKIKQEIKHLIEKEDKKKPFTDHEIMDKLIEKGYMIARRTTTKYRVQMGIPARNIRKERF